MIAVVIKLVSGEEVFAEVTNVDEEGVLIQNPVRIDKVLLETSEGIISKLNFEPFMDYMTSKEHYLRREHVMILEPLPENLVKMYTDMVIDISKIGKIEKKEPEGKVKVLH